MMNDTSTTTQEDSWDHQPEEQQHIADVSMDESDADQSTYDSVTAAAVVGGTSLDRTWSLQGEASSADEYDVDLIEQVPIGSKRGGGSSSKESIAWMDHVPTLRLQPRRSTTTARIYDMDAVSGSNYYDREEDKQRSTSPKVVSQQSWSHHPPPALIVPFIDETISNVNNKNNKKRNRVIQARSCSTPDAVEDQHRRRCCSDASVVRKSLFGDDTTPTMPRSSISGGTGESSPFKAIPSPGLLSSPNDVHKTFGPSVLSDHFNASATTTPPPPPFLQPRFSSPPYKRRLFVEGGGGGRSTLIKSTADRKGGHYIGGTTVVVERPSAIRFTQEDLLPSSRKDHNVAWEGSSSLLLLSNSNSNTVSRMNAPLPVSSVKHGINDHSNDNTAMSFQTPDRLVLGGTLPSSSSSSSSSRSFSAFTAPAC